jgi:hypothetical protein
MLNTIFILSALLFIVAMVVQILATQAFFNRLNAAHHELYLQMGRPRWKIQVGDDSFREAVKYIRSRSFKELNDAELERIYRTIKASDWSAVAVGLIAVGVTLLEAVRGV